MDEPFQRHVTFEEMVDYFDEDLPAEETERLENHFAVCDDCAAQARKSYALLGQMEQWTPRLHGKAALLAEIDRCFTEARDRQRSEVPGWKARIERWRTSSAEIASKAARAAAEAIASAFDTNSLVAAPVLGDTEARPRSERKVALHSQNLPETCVARVAVDDRREEIEVRVDNFPADRPEPLLFLVSLGTAGSGQIVPLERQDEGFLYVLIKNVAPGNYVGYFEPAH